MSILSVHRRAEPGAPKDVLLTRDAEPRAGWVISDTIAATWQPVERARPFYAWRRRLPRPGHVVTAGDAPAAVGDWSLDFVFYAEEFNAAPVESVRPRPVVPTDELKLVKPLLLDVIDILNRHDFPYWADSGTMLGAMRHRGIIPWDKDCDLGIRREHKRDLIRLIRTAAPGFGLVRTNQSTMWLMSLKYRIRLSDVFTFTYQRRFRSTFWTRYARKFGVDLDAGFLVYDHRLFKRYYDQRFNLPMSLFDPPRLVPFYDRRIKVPRRARTLLRGLYGDDCFTHASTDNLNSEGALITRFAPL
jgi:hypothetical protein